MNGYYRGLILAAAVAGSIISEGESYRLRTNNLLFGYLPPKIQNQLEGPVAAVSGALAGDILLLTLLEQYLKRKKE